MLFITLVLLALAGACVGPESTQTATPTPTSVPLSGRDDISDQLVVDKLLEGLSADELQCVDAAFTGEELLRLVREELDQLAARDGPPPERDGDLHACLTGDELISRPVLRALARALPKVAAPHCRGSEELPGDPAGVFALLRQLPAQIGERERTEFDDEGPYHYRVGYGERMAVQAMDVSVGEFSFYSATAIEAMAVWALGADWDVEAAARDQDVLWARIHTTGDGEDIYAIIWGNQGSRWVFSAMADTPDHLDALVAAFVAVANTR